MSIQFDNTTAGVVTLKPGASGSYSMTMPISNAVGVFTNDGSGNMSFGVGIFPAGTAAAPAITTTGDTNNGIFFPSADVVAITTNGSERLRVDSGGNVGIGTSSPVSQLTLAKTSDLVFTQNGYGITWSSDNGSPRIYGTSGGTLSFKHGGGSVGMLMNSSGQVGIGITSPAALLHVGGLNGTGSLNGYTKLAVEASDYAVVTWKSPAANFSQIIFTDTTATSLGGINYFNSTNGTPNAMAFLTAATERMRITSSGNVGIGTSSPNCVFHVVGGIGSTSGNPTSSGAAITMFYDTSNDYGVTSVLNNGVAWKQYVIRSAGLIFKTSSDSEAARFDTSGQLGIGTSSPGAKLDVNGAIQSRGDGTEGGELRLNNITNSATALLLDIDTSNNVRMYNNLATNTIFYTNAAERMRIDSSGYFYFNSGYGSSAKAYGCRAWCQYNQSATIVGAGNVSSITIVDTGDVRLNFATAMPDNNYSAVATTNESGGQPKWCNSTQPSTTDIRIVTFNASQSKGWFEYNFVAVFR